MLMCRNVFLKLRRFQSSTKYFSMDNLLPPSDVRGMKKLNKELFEKIVQVPCIVLELNNLKDTLNYVKPYLLKMVSLNPIRIRDDSYKEILLNPNLVSSFDDFNVEARNVICGIDQNVQFERVKVKLTYENWKASEILSAVIPKELGSVSGYSVIGHIVHLNLRSEFAEYRDVVGQVLLDKVPQAKTVVNKMDIIDNEFRTFQLEILAGVDDYKVKVVENKFIYKFDFSKVYWNPRLSTEHLRVVNVLNAGDILYDAFAGVGPFTIPAAKKGCTVFANDLNSDAIECLRENLRLNKVSNSVMTSIKDAGNFIIEEFKNHFIQLKPGNFKVIITMNLPALAPTFLKYFKGIFCFEDAEKIRSLPIPEVFIYCFIKGESDPCKSAKLLIAENLSMDLEDEIKSVSFVRNVAPNKEMMRVVLALTPKILLSQKRIASPIKECDNKKSNIEFLSQEEDKKTIRKDENSKEIQSV